MWHGIDGINKHISLEQAILASKSIRMSRQKRSKPNMWQVDQDDLFDPWDNTSRNAAGLTEKFLSPCEDVTVNKLWFEKFQSPHIDDEAAYQTGIQQSMMSFTSQMQYLDVCIHFCHYIYSA